MSDTAHRLDVLKPETRWKPLGDAQAHETLRESLSAFDAFDAWPSMEDLNAVLRARDVKNAQGMPLVCELQAPKTKRRRARVGLRSRDALYDARIDALGLLPTRAANYHDFFNAMVWATFPLSKAAIAARQHAIWKRELAPMFAQLPSRRTREQDALAMLDEGGLIVAASPALERELRARCEAGDEAWLRSQRATHAVQTFVFGHALHEHMVSTQSLIRANPIVVILDAHADEGGAARPSSALARPHLPSADVDAALAANIASTAHFMEPTPGAGFFIGAGGGALFV